MRFICRFRAARPAKAGSGHVTARLAVLSCRDRQAGRPAPRGPPEAGPERGSRRLTAPGGYRSAIAALPCKTAASRRGSGRRTRSSSAEQDELQGVGIHLDTTRSERPGSALDVIAPVQPPWFTGTDAHSPLRRDDASVCGACRGRRPVERDAAVAQAIRRHRGRSRDDPGAGCRAAGRRRAPRP